MKNPTEGFLVTSRAALRGGHSDKMSGAPWLRGARRAHLSQGTGAQKLGSGGARWAQSTQGKLDKY